MEARLKGVALNAFKLQDYGIPYGYAPVLMADPALIAEERESVVAFLAATARGFEYAATHPGEAASLLVEGAKEQNDFELDHSLVLASQLELGPEYLNAEGRWVAHLARIHKRIMSCNPAPCLGADSHGGFLTEERRSTQHTAPSSKRHEICAVHDKTPAGRCCRLGSRSMTRSART